MSASRPRVAAPAGASDDALQRIRHSAAHVLAQAVAERFGPDGPVQLGGGPPTATGFHYDFLLPRAIDAEDLGWLQERMAAIVAEDHAFACEAVSPEEARRRFAEQPFKLELIEGIASGRLDADGRATAEDGRELTVYRHASFEDLCAGPHVASTSQIDMAGVRLRGVAGAHWKGDESRPMLQRIQALAFACRADLEAHEAFLEEVQRRDHRRVGRELELFHFEDHAPGMPYWLPAGLRVLNALVAFWREHHEALGYEEISTPLVNHKSLWETSGHWDHYREEMFVIEKGGEACLGLKPMNCPGAMVIFAHRPRSYRELPLRLSDCDVLHRNERSGTLHGLLRVQKFQQDDAHIFLAEEQIEGEIRRILDLTDALYQRFGLTHRYRVGTRPDDALGDTPTWQRAERILHGVLGARVGEGGYEVAEGDGAFYGPKIDILMTDAIGREWQMGTIQLDFQLPRRFDCRYVDERGRRRCPVVIHHVLFGSLERFLGILLEHTEGHLPFWLAPVHAAVLPVGEPHREAADALARQLFERGRLRAEVDDAGDRLGARVRRGFARRIPCLLVLGDREVAENTVSVRRRGRPGQQTVPTEALIAELAELRATRAE